MQRLFTQDLLPGMVTAEDVYSFTNQLIIPVDTLLTPRLIARLEFYSVISVKVKDEVIEIPFWETEGDSYSERIKNSAQFQVFKKLFIEQVNDLKGSMQDILDKDETPDTEVLLKNALSIVPAETTNLGVFDMLHNMREFDDQTYTHCLNVALICNVFSKWLGFSAEDVNTATLCGLLHDIGKLKVPDNLIQKPAPLSKEEFEVVKRHTLDGYQILKSRNMDENIQLAALLHHERCDGSGYPGGVTRSQLNKFARIVAIADVYDAMTSARVYRGPICPFTVLDIFESEGLRIFDCEYILIFLQNIVNTYINNDVLLSDGRKGTVILINKRRVARPILNVEGNVVDLSREPNLVIEKII